MNVKNEIPPQSGKTFHSSSPQIPNKQEIVLRPEEVKMYKDCSYSLYYKAGLPFAIFCSVLSNFLKKPDSPPTTLTRKGLTFFGNVILGTLFFSPTCYYKLIAMRRDYERQKKEMETQILMPVEENKSEILPEDFSYPVDVISNLNESEANFSSDFSTPIGLLSDDEKNSKRPITTYQDLRAQHRSSYATKPTPSPSSINFEPDLSSSLYSPPVDKPMTTQQPSSELPPRRVARNKYGDEIE